MARTPDAPVSISKILSAAAITGLLCGGGAWTIASATTDAPQRESFVVSAPAHRGIAQVEIHDPDNVLSPADEARLKRDASRIEAPDVVQQLHYIVFSSNHENVNDSVEEYLRDNRPDLIGDEKFVDGTIFVGVGLDPRQAFVFAGEDVTDVLSLRDGSHLEGAVNAIKPGVKDNNIPAGLFAGASAATDAKDLEQSQYQDAVDSRIGLMAGAGLGTGGATSAAVAGVGFYRRERKKKLAAARENLAFIAREYGSLGQRLDGIDIRANSLTSPLAHAAMRAEWEDVRDRFLDLHQSVEAYGGLTESGDPKQILSQADKIQDAADTTRQLSFAEDNIDKIFNIEHGNTEVRTQEITALRADIVQAEASLPDSNSGLHDSLTSARKEADLLAAKPDAPDFLDRYVQLLRDYQAALVVLKEKQMSEVEDTNELHRPALYEASYRPGYGYMDFVPYWALSSWHSANVESAQSNSSGNSVNSGFSSGFSGAGGSSSF